MLNVAMREWRQAISDMPHSTLGEVNLIVELCMEVNDPEFASQRHGQRHTRNLGCKGPLCQKALRDWQRERLLRMHEERGTIPRPYRRSRDMVRVDETLAPVKAAFDKLYDARIKYADEEQLTSSSHAA